MPSPLDQVHWTHGAPDCAHSTDPLLQVHAFDDDTLVLRVSKCFNFEGNFIYLLIGKTQAMLLDTGPAPEGDPTRRLPLRATVDDVIAQREAKLGGGAIRLIVAHTHGHADHAHADGQFSDRPHTTVVQPTLAAVKSFFGLPHWPDGEATIDLGGRVLTILPLPGHEQSHIAVYDPATQALLTGDTLYPGLLTVRDFAAYRRSAERLAAFAAGHPVALVLGCHIEMKNVPRQLYAIGTTHQPDEHPLPLALAHLQEWHAACQAMPNPPHRDIHDDFIIEPV